MCVQFEYSYASNDDPVRKAVLANMRGSFTKPDKPKVWRLLAEINFLGPTLHISGIFSTLVMLLSNQKIVKAVVILANAVK